MINVEKSKKHNIILEGGRSIAYDKLNFVESCYCSVKSFFLSVIIVFCVGVNLIAQQDSVITNLMSEVENQVKRGAYDEALIPLNQLISLDTILPDRFSFYMGVTFYHYKKWGKARESLLKYIEVAGEGTLFFVPAVGLVKETDRELGIQDTLRCRICKYLGPLQEIEGCDICNGSGKESFQCRNCSGHGEILCYICGGSGVQRSAGTFGDLYATCHMCTGSGKTECFICEGSALELEICRTCLGEGNRPKARNCTHENYNLEEKNVPGYIPFFK